MLALFLCYKRVFWFSIVMLFAVASVQLIASPWVEADDAYLKSNIQLLADAGVIRAPVQTYPLPWHAIARDLKQAKLDNQPSHVLTAYQHVRYALETAQLGRGNKQVKLTAANAASQSSFGQYNIDEWQLASSYSATLKNTAARLNLNYGQAHGEQSELNVDGSFVAYTTGDVDITLGALHKWWGASWQSSLAQPFQSRSEPSFYLSYAGDDLSELESVYMEGGVSYINDVSPYQQKWAGRLNVAVTQPVSLAASYIRYQDKTDNAAQQWLWYGVLDQANTSNSQFIIEARVALPAYNGWYAGLYTQQLISDNTSQQGANITGIEAQSQLLQAQVRLVIENRINPLSDDSKLNHYLQALPKIQDGQIYQLGSLSNQLSIGGYAQLDNNQQFNLFYHRESYQQAHHRLSSEYQIPLFNGLFGVQLSINDANWQSDHIQLATSWDYRF